MSNNTSPLFVIGAIGRYLDLGHDFVNAQNVQDEFEQEYQYRPEPFEIEPVLSVLATFGFLIAFEYEKDKFKYSRPMRKVITVDMNDKVVDGAYQPNLPLWQPFLQVFGE